MRNKTVPWQIIKLSTIVSFLICTLLILVYGLGHALGPLLISMTLSYLLFPIIHKLEHHGLKRHWAIVIIFSIILLIVLLVSFFLIPLLIKETRLFFNELPIILKKAIGQLEILAKQYGLPFEVERNELYEKLKQSLPKISFDQMAPVGLILRKGLSGILSILLAIINLFLIPLFFFYIMDDFESISEKILGLIPPKLRSWGQQVEKKINRVLSGYIRGQLMVAGILSILYSIGLGLTGLPFGLAIGLLTGMLSIIPYVGVSLGLTTSLVVVFTNYSSASLLLGVLSVFIVTQMLEGFFITPKLVGDKVGLNSLTTMLAIMIGGNLLGLKGVLLAIPVAGIIKILLSEIAKQYLSSEFYRKG